MNKVPLNRNRQIDRLRSGRQKAIVIGGVPVPAGSDGAACVLGQRVGLLDREVRDEIDRKSPLVCALPRSRFRTAFFEEAFLPPESAERLKDFEVGLREAGFVSDAELLVQSFNSPTKFRVQKRKAGDPVLGHDGVPSVKVPARERGHESTLSEGPKPVQDEGGPVKGLSGASLDGVPHLANREMIPVQYYRAKRGRF